MTDALPSHSAPVVSVIVPCYGYAHFLEGCVESVLSQPDVAVEVIIVDDASPDRTPSVASGLVAADDRVRYVRNDRNLGHIATYNRGLALAEGGYVVLLSADDRLTPGALSRAVALMEAEPRVGFVYGRAPTFADDDHLPPVRTGHPRWKIHPGETWIAGRCRRGHNCISSPEVVVRGSLARSVGGYAEELPHTADLEMWMRLAARADVGFLRGVDQALYRVHPDSMLRTRFDTVMADLVQRRAAFERFFATSGHRLSREALLSERALRALAREALWCAARAYDRGRVATVPVDDLTAFAQATYPRVRRLLIFWTLAMRRRIGARWCPYLQPLVLTAVWRRLTRPLRAKRQRWAGA